MLDLFKSFATQEDFFYDGAFIAKVKYQKFKSTSGTKIYKNEILKNNKKLCIINCNGYINDEIVETLTVYLMMNVTVKKLNETVVMENRWTLWHNFSKEEIANFSYLTGDTNSIHLTENPVVQGLFILKELCNMTNANEIEVKYVHPIYGCNPVYIKVDENIIEGFSNNILCFKANLKNK
ncbi:hypothetical protein NNC19_10775 [Clostridium sp. SHJSY1]|uniref:hypothetical protein n=1 Tax=Clostridium sp. SHJSY1 TaxID=2942483 RepID=UPI0028758F13|nr:hypothetical protein [Clostridium sp. SHJSY1]MDS0526165.1 hypothetical protein [Clostridium sp. SHJSY1]